MSRDHISQMADYKQLSQSCYTLHKHPIRFLDLVKEEVEEGEEQSHFAVFLYSDHDNSPCSTESSSHTSITSESGCTDNCLDLLEINIEEEMAASWSSASTGKPQLSYAERLRKAKEGHLPTSSAVGAASSKILLDSGEKASKSPAESTSSRQNEFHPIQITSFESSGKPASHQVTSPGSSSKLTIPEIDASSGIAENQTTPQPLVNVWDARKRILREKERVKQELGVGTLVSSVAGPSRSTSEASQVDKVGISNKSTKSSKGGQISARASEQNDPIQGDVWLQKIQILNGGIDGQQSRRDLEQSRRANKSRVSVLDVEQSQSSIREDQAKAKTSKKKKDEITDTRSKTLPPSLNDVTAWPSPDVSISSTSRLPSETRSEERNIRQSATSSPSNGVQGLDVELVKRIRGDTQKKGKQWIPIVPTITHTAPLPGVQSKKKSNRSQSFATSNGNSPSERLESKRPNTLSLRENQIQSSLTSPTLSSRTAEASTSSTLSPRLDPRNSLPKLPRKAAKEQNLSASPRRGQSSSPLLRSPSIEGSGSIRGPRFSGDTMNSPKNNGNSTPVDVTDELNLGEGITSRLNNALHFSHQPVQDSPNHNKDGSFSPVRATARTFSPISSSQFIDNVGPWQANPDRHSKNGTASPRGSRGRGKSSKTSEGSTPPRNNGSKTDFEERGLPSDVPSGPRHRSGDAPLTPPREGARHYRRNYNNMVNYSNLAMPMSYGPPGAMYGQASVGPFYHPPQSSLERTPIEFAPQGTLSNSEPSHTLLHQIEFYFSHRNLEGDFYLRKNMDSQGYVPIKFVANFNKVKKMTEEIEVIKATLLFSKVLQVDTERNLVRKLVDWHLYVLTDGERPQQDLHLPFTPRQSQPFPPQSPQPPPFLAPVSFGQMNFYGSQPQPLYFPVPYNQGYPIPQLQSSTMQGGQPNENQQWSHQPLPSSRGPAEGQERTDEANGDNVSKDDH